MIASLINLRLIKIISVCHEESFSGYLDFDRTVLLSLIRMLQGILVLRIGASCRQCTSEDSLNSHSIRDISWCSCNVRFVVVLKFSWLLVIVKRMQVFELLKEFHNGLVYFLCFI